jgi:hypothetical protein
LESLTVWLIGLAVFMLAVTWHAHRLGNERRDVGFLAAVAGLLGFGSVVSALV